MTPLVPTNNGANHSFPDAADSHLSSNYFTLVTMMHMTYAETATTTLYAAPIIFDRNADTVPAMVRVADIL